MDSTAKEYRNSTPQKTENLRRPWCPLCRGTGWRFVNLTANLVERCDHQKNSAPVPSTKMAAAGDAA
ncbi:MAG: hypothetical protein WBE45_09555 [Terriglobales bacterium]